MESITELRARRINNQANDTYHSIIPHLEKSFTADNSVSVNVFPPFPLNEETAEELDRWVVEGLQKLSSDRKYVLFDNVHEGNVYSCLPGIYAMVHRLNLDPKQCVFVTGAMDADIMHTDWCNEHLIWNDQKIHIARMMAWERHMVRHMSSIEPTYTPTRRDKNFLCFNRMARKHRIALLGLLYEENLVQKGHYSFFPEAFSGQLPSLVGGLSSYLSGKTYNSIREQIFQHRPEFPLLLNVDSVALNVNYVKDDDRPLYDSSYYSLVTETFFFGDHETDQNKLYDECGVFFSEKIFKPIACKHPFLLVGRPYSLEYLRELGYLTFSSIIDEYYDTIHDDEQRLLAIVEEVKRLSTYSDADWMEFQRKAIPIVEYNYHLLKNRLSSEHSLDL